LAIIAGRAERAFDVVSILERDGRVEVSILRGAFEVGDAR